jgi:arsenate reductase
MIQIYHNPHCGKSRNCLAFIQEKNKEVEIIKYLEQQLNFEDLVLILKKLNCKPIEMVRIKEKIWIENYKDKNISDTEIIQAMVLNPILIERPIVINGKKAIIGRIIEEVSAFI